MDVADDAERHFWVLLQRPQFVSFRCAVDIKGVVAVPYEVEWYAVAGVVSVYHRQNSILSRAKELQGSCLIHQSVSATDSIVYVFHI